MKGMTVAILGDADLGAELGKKGAVTDISYFNLKREDTGITYLYPSRYPDKVQSLTYALAMADFVIFCQGKPDKDFGEMVVAVDAFAIENGFFILKDYVQPEEIAPFIKGTTLEKFEYVEKDPITLNEKMLEAVLDPVSGPSRIPVDQFFDVKGIGTVILGTVKQGVVKQHDVLEVFPTGKTAQVRSIQVHDSDVKEAYFGNRVGLALKNISSGDFDRGHVLAEAGSMSTADTMTLELSLSKYWKGELVADSVIHAQVGLQIKPARVSAVSGGKLGAGESGEVTLKFEYPIAYDPNTPLVVLNFDSPGLRVVGRGRCR